MTKEQFFDAFGQIDGAYVLAAGDAIYGKTETARVSYKKLVRTLIIAAVIAALLTLTAYAAGLFGLTGRVINDPGGSSFPRRGGRGSRQAARGTPSGLCLPRRSDRLGGVSGGG